MNILPHFCGDYLDGLSALGTGLGYHLLGFASIGQPVLLGNGEVEGNANNQTAKWFLTVLFTICRTVLLLSVRRIPGRYSNILAAFLFQITNIRISIRISCFKAIVFLHFMIACSWTKFRRFELGFFCLIWERMSILF